MRRGQFDNTGRTVRNLMINPGCENTSGTVVVRTNLALDPSATSLTNWSIIGSLATTRTIDTTIFHEGTSGIRYTANATGQLGAKCMMSGVIASGDLVSWSMWVYSSVAMTIRPYWERTAPTYVGGSDPTTTAVVANTWTKLTSTYTFNSTQADPAGVYGFGFLATTSCNSADYVVCDEILIEKEPWIGTWFSGSTTASGDFTYGWVGTTNASASNMNGVGIVTVTPSYMQNTKIISSTDWAANGTKSARVIPYTSNADSSFNLPVTLQNKTYTLMATCRVKTPQTGTLDTRARRIQLYYTGTGASSSVQAPNVTGVYPLSATFTVTDSTQYYSLRLYNGSTYGNGDIWWDNIMLVEGAYSGDFINPGVTPFSKWDGAANASTSVGYPTQLSDFAGKPFYDGSNVAMSTNFVAPNGPLTIYSVQSLGAASGNPGYWELSNSSGWTSSTGVVRLIGSLVNAGRLDVLIAPSGATNTNTSTLDPLNLQVTAVALDPVNSGVDMQMNGATTVTVAANASFRTASGATFRVGTRDGGLVSTVTTTRILVYQGKHNLATRQAISRYLGNKYGVNVA